MNAYACPFLVTVLFFSPPPQPAEVPGLVNQLGSARFQDRERASDRLLSLGAAALPACRAAARPGSDAEVCHRASLIVEAYYGDCCSKTELRNLFALVDTTTALRYYWDVGRSHDWQPGLYTYNSAWACEATERWARASLRLGVPRRLVLAKLTSPAGRPVVIPAEARPVHLDADAGPFDEEGGDPDDD